MHLIIILLTPLVSNVAVIITYECDRAFAANFAAELFLNSARPFLGSLFEKMEVYGTQRDRWVPRLLRDIPENVLPKAYGGTSKFNAV